MGRRRATVVALAGAAAFLLDSFLAWHETAVRVAGAVDLVARSSGWNGWGMVAIVFAAATFVLALMPPASGHRRLAMAGAGAALLVSTVLAVFTGQARLDAGAVGVEAGAVLWPAWLGRAQRQCRA